MTKTRGIGLWFLATCAIFFTRAILFSSFVSRGPEVQAALHLNTGEMGLLSVLYPAGGLAGITFASALVNRFGARAINSATFLIGSVGFVALGFSITGGNLVLSAVLLFIIGLPMAISDFVGNYQGTEVNNASKRSLMPAIHGAFGLGMLMGANLASLLISSQVGLATSFTIVGVFVGVASLFAGMVFSSRATVALTTEEIQVNRSNAVKVWFEKRTLLIAIIGFSFIMAETSAGTWVPIALTQVGYSGSEAAFAFGILWILVTFGRAVGGPIVDKLGRRTTVLASSLLTATGILIFMGGASLNLPYVGLVCWGLGIALGMPMAVSAMGDDPKMASPRVNMIITMVYVASVSVGPTLGALGQSLGIYVAFAIPLTMMLVSAAISGVTKPASGQG
jgi:MFS family permease